jgi:hypothetical protein
MCVPLYYDGTYESLCDETTSKISRDLGYQIGLYIHAGAFLVSLVFDRYVHIFQGDLQENLYS